MTFGVPAALLALLAVPLLILLERWRRRPRETTWPSLLLWRAVAAEEAPARRRFERLLLYECLAVTLLALAAAEPAVLGARAERVAVVLLDVGPHMQARRADGTTVAEATRAEIERIRAAVDRVEVFPARGDLGVAAAALPPGDLRVVATDRPGVEGGGYVVVGRAADGDNLGIDAVEVDGDRLWFALATDGEAREVSVRVGGETARVRTGVGHETAFAERIEILDPDNYDGDDVVALARPGLVARDDTGSRLVRAALFAAGTPARPGDAPGLVITREGGTPVEGPVRGSECVSAGPLFDGLFLDACAWRGVKAREGAGTPLLVWRGAVIAAWLDPATLWLGMPVDAEWDEHATLALLIEKAKRQRVVELLPSEAVLVGDAYARPAPGHVSTKGVDRPWRGAAPEAGRPARGRTGLRAGLALLAAAVLGLYLRAIVRRS